MSLQYHVLADPLFFEVPARGADRFPVAVRTPPPGWTRTDRDPWVTVAPADATLPSQGWKIHVSGVPETGSSTCEAVWDYCVANGVAFKFLNGPRALTAHSAKYADRAGSGKLLTVYPVDETELRRVLDGLHAILGGQPGPYILSDLRWHDGPIYVRYGGFLARPAVTADGGIAHVLRDPDGREWPDVRRPVFSVPPWVTLPGFLEPHLAARRTGGTLPYRIERALHFSNGGGVYLARRTGDGLRVVLKEARPLAGLDARGDDAVTRLRRERWALSTLAGIPGIPALVDYLVVGEHEFLALEHVAGPGLFPWQGAQHPFVIRDKDVAGYTTAALELHRRLTETVAACHARGVVFGDLHPGNVIVRADGQPFLVDFECAAEIEAAGIPAMWARGFDAPPELIGVARDRWALAALGLWFFVPLTRVLPLAPRNLDRFLDLLGARFPVPAEFVAELRATLMSRGYAGLTGMAAATFGAAAAAQRAAAEPPQSVADPAAATQSMARAMVASASPGRTDRLFPADVAGFGAGAVGFAHGAGGMLWALSALGHARDPEHEKWFLDAAAREPVRPGFLTGTYGTAYLADRLGHPALAHDLLGRLARVDGRVEAVDLRAGLAGIGLALLHFADADQTYVDRALALADRVWAAARAPGVGLLRGWSGVALFLAQLYRRTGDSVFLHRAVEAIGRDLDRCVPTAGGGLAVDEPGVRVLPYLDGGSAGIAVAIDELLDLCDDERLSAALPELVRACDTEMVIHPGLFTGRAGHLTAVARCGARLPVDLRPVLARHLAHFDLYAVGIDGELAFPGAQLMRVSMDVATGTAGVLVAVHAATAPGAEPVLPFLSPRPPWCGRGAAPVVPLG